MRNGEIVIEKPCNKEENKPQTEDKRGWPKIFNNEDEDYVIDQANQKISSAKAVTLDWATKICNQKLSTVGEHVSLFYSKKII